MSTEEREETEREFGITFDEFLDEDLDLVPASLIMYPKRYKNITEVTPEDFLKIEEYFNNVVSTGLQTRKERAKRWFNHRVLPYKNEIMSGDCVVFIGKVNNYDYLINVARYNNANALQCIPNAYAPLLTYPNNYIPSDNTFTEIHIGI